MQQLRLFFATALLYMFRVTIPPIIRSTMLYMAFQVDLCCNFVNILVVLSLSVVLSWRWSLSCYALLFLWMLSVELISLLSMMHGTTNITLLLNLVGCLYYLYQWSTVKQISGNEMYLLIKYIQSVLCRVAKRLSYIEDARCLKVT